MSHVWCWASGGTLRETGAGPGGDTEAGGCHPQGADILLWLEQDDVDLRSKEAAQHHRPTQTDRDAHGGGLNLQDERQARNSVSKPEPWSAKK